MSRGNYIKIYFNYFNFSIDFRSDFCYTVFIAGNTRFNNKREAIMKLTKQEKIERKEHFIKVLKNIVKDCPKNLFGIHIGKSGKKYHSNVFIVDSKGKIQNITLYVGIIGEFKMTKNLHEIISNDSPENIIKGVLTGILGSAKVYRCN